MATDATLRIKIGVSVDADASRVFEPIERASGRARKRVKDNLDAALKTGGSGSDNPYRESGRMVEKGALAEMRAAQKKFDFMKKIHADLLREQAAAEEKNERHRMVRNQRIADSSALRMSGGTVRDVGRGLNAARNVALDMARGAGVNMDFGSLVKQNVELEARASKLSNASWDFKKGEGARTSTADVMGTVQTVASATGSDMGDVLGALENFVSKTGDIQTARDALMDMAKISKATGASLADMMNSSGDIAIQLGDAAGKGEILSQVAKIMAGQGQVGAVEYKDMANGIAVIAAKQGKFKLSDATKNLFAGAGVTSDVAANVGVMGVLTQAVRQSGGKATARQSLNSAQAFIRDLTGGSGLKRMGEFGIDPFADKEKTTLRDPKELILEMLKKTGGDQKKLARLLPNQNSRAVVDAFSGTFEQGMTEAKKRGEKDPEKIRAAGLAKVSARFDDLAKASMSDAEVSDKFNAAMQTTESKANQFNVELAKVASATGQKLVPALMTLAPLILKAAESMGKMVGWAAENPMTAVVSLIGASVAKNVGQEVFRAAIEKAIVGRIGAYVGPAGASSSLVPGLAPGGTARRTGVGGLADDYKGMGALGTATTALAIASMAVAAFQVGKMYIDEMIDNKAKADTKASDDVAKYLNVPGAVREKEQAAVESGVVSPEQQAELDAAYAEEKAKYEEVKARVIKAQANKNVDGGRTSFMGQVFESGWNTVAGAFGKEGASRSWSQINADNADVGELENLKAAMDKIGGHLQKELQVKVTNMPKGGLPGMPPGAVTPADAIP